MGRRKIPPNEKQLFQRVPIRYETYLKVKKKVEEGKKNIHPKYTISDVIEFGFAAGEFLNEESKKR